MSVNRQHIAIIVILIPGSELLFGIEECEHIRNQNILRTVILLHAVVAGGAGDQIL